MSKLLNQVNCIIFAYSGCRNRNQVTEKKWAMFFRIEIILSIILTTVFIIDFSLMSLLTSFSKTVKFKLIMFLFFNNIFNSTASNFESK